MKRQIVLKNKKIIYTIKKNKRTRKIKLAVYCDGSVVITAPYILGQKIIDNFIVSKASWLFSKINLFKRKKILKRSRKDYLKNKESARILAESKAAYFSKIYGYRYNRINIKNQKTRWGSCSKKGNLNFNYQVLFLSEKLQNYIIVHELCHLKEFNHSKEFWRLVKIAVPDYIKARRELKRNILY